MARLPTGLVVLALASALFVAPPTPAAAATTFDSGYRFESAFLADLLPGDTGQFSVFFENTGSAGWVANTPSEVVLATCRSDKVTCGGVSELASWNPGTWVSASVYARQAKALVAPGEQTAFTYQLKVPTGATAGTYRFNGDLMVLATRLVVHPEGYFQDATVISPALAAPRDLLVGVGNYDSGSTANDARLVFSTLTSTAIVQYDVLRAPEVCPVTPASGVFVKVTTIGLTGSGTTGYTDNDLRPGNYCYQIRVQDPSTGRFTYSNQVIATVFGSTDSASPTISSATLTSDTGNVGTLDTNDSISLSFSKAVTLQTSASIQLTDGDCGAPASQSSSPPACGSGQTQTVATVVCGTNATCTLGLDGKSLVLALTSSPQVFTAGSAPGVQFPAVITATTGIRDAANTAISLSGSADRSIGP